MRIIGSSTATIGLYLTPRRTRHRSTGLDHALLVGVFARTPQPAGLGSHDLSLPGDGRRLKSFAASAQRRETCVMLLVSFHGGSSGINNVYAYSTPDGALVTQEALAQPSSGTLSELRAMVLANGLLYVANGAKSSSTVLAYTVPSSGPLFTNPSTL